jgi:hypothetical protein
LEIVWLSNPSYCFGMQQLLQYLAGEGRVILGAPIALAVTALLMFAAAHLASAWRYGRTIDGLKADNDTLKERIQLRDDRAAEYERKLQGASPDQAKAEIDELRKQLADLAPPRLSREQARAIVAIASKAPAEMQVLYDGTDPNAAYSAQDFLDAFARAGWNAGGITSMGDGGPPRLLVTLPKDSEAGRVLVEGLHSAGLDFDVARGDLLTFGRLMPNLLAQISLPLYRR